jgi:hypothetical protein
MSILLDIIHKIADNKDMKTIMFTGHRDSICSDVFLENIALLYGDCNWIHGGAVGFDSQVENIAIKNGIKTTIYKPNYKDNPAKIAPLIRNKEMLSVCDIVIACYDGRKQGGTYFTVKEARKLSKKIIITQPHHHISTQ